MNGREPRWRCTKCGRTFTVWESRANPGTGAQDHMDVEHGGGIIETVLRRRGE